MNFYSCSRIQVLSSSGDLIIPKKGECRIDVCEEKIGTISLKVVKSNEIIGAKDMEIVKTFKVQ